jgi:hypothetical protein
LAALGAVGRRAVAGGLLFGGLFYGAPLALVHLLYNRLASPWDGVVTLFWFFLLYGAWAAGTFAVTAGLAWGAGRLLSPRTPPAEALLLARGVPLGIFLFQLVFWVLYALYGLTYDQLPAFLRPEAGPGTMVGYLAFLLVVLTLAIAGFSWLLGRLLMSLHRSGRVLRWAAALGIVALTAHLVVPLVLPSPPPLETGETPTLEATPRDFPLLFVGLDGADWQVMEPLLAAGELPTFQRLMDEGVAAPLETIPDANSAVIWASMYTGERPEAHGIHDFYRIELPGMVGPGLFPVHRTYFKELVGFLERVGLARRTMVSRFTLEAPPFWEIADHLGLSSGVVDGYFYSFPAYTPKTPEGFVLAYGLDGFERRLGSGGRSADLPLFLQPPQLYRQIRPYLDRGDFHWQAASLLTLLEEGHPQPRLLSFYTHEPDTVQHHFWKWYQPELFPGVSAEEVREKGGRIPDLYRAFDHFLETLLPRLDPRTAVVIASDHGHAATILHGRFFTQHRHGPPGIVIASGGPFRAAAEGGALDTPHVYDLFPTLLYLLGIPIPEYADGRVWTEALEEAFLEEAPRRTTVDYRSLLQPLPGEGQGDDRERNRQEIEKLKSLGYI